MNNNPEFVARFIEMCGSREPSKIQRLLNIPYQTAKNYLGGRLPQTDMLIAISKKTSCSIDWLLTGQGNKHIGEYAVIDTPIAIGQMEAFVRRVCVEVFNELTERQEPAQSTIVKIQSRDLMSEKVRETNPALNENQS